MVFARFNYSGPTSRGLAPKGDAALTVSGFQDVRADTYYADAVKGTVDQRISNDATGTSFDPGKACTCGQIITESPNSDHGFLNVKCLTESERLEISVN